MQITRTNSEVSFKGKYIKPYIQDAKWKHKIKDIYKRMPRQDVKVIEKNGEKVLADKAGNVYLKFEKVVRENIDEIETLYNSKQAAKTISKIIKDRFNNVIQEVVQFFNAKGEMYKVQMMDSDGKKLWNVCGEKIRIVKGSNPEVISYSRPIFHVPVKKGNPFIRTFYTENGNALEKMFYNHDYKLTEIRRGLYDGTSSYPVKVQVLSPKRSLIRTEMPPHITSNDGYYLAN